MTSHKRISIVITTVLLVITGLVALALWSAGQPLLGLLLAVLSIVYQALVYATGGRLLESR